MYTNTINLLVSIQYFSIGFTSALKEIVDLVENGKFSSIKMKGIK